jgi:hypothetical protein
VFYLPSDTSGAHEGISVQGKVTHRFEVFMAKLKVVFFRVMMLCSIFVGYQHFRDFTLKMEAAGTSETMVSCHSTTWSQNPDLNLNNPHISAAGLFSFTKNLVTALC